ncbi:MAG: type II secretion system F family protein [Roseburia sp.]
MLYGAEGILGIAVLDYVFYRSAGLSDFAVFPVGILFPLVLKKTAEEKAAGEPAGSSLRMRSWQWPSGLNAGYSVENAFAVSLKEMEEIHGSDSMIAQEIRLILRKGADESDVRGGIGGLCEARSGLDDVKNFCGRVSCGEKKRRGTDADHRQDRGDHRRKNPDQEEILTATASRRMEQKIMSAIPILIVIYIELTSPGFFEILYSTHGRTDPDDGLPRGSIWYPVSWLKSFLEIEI